MADDLFREEALRRFREGGRQGQVLRLAPDWTARASALLLAAAAAAIAVLWLGTVPVSVQGPATAMPGGRVLALLPAAREREVRPGATLAYRSEDGRSAVLSIERVEPRVVSPDEARALSGGAFARHAVPETGLLVWATPAPGTEAPEGTGRVTLSLGRQRLAELLLPRTR